MKIFLILCLAVLPFITYSQADSSDNEKKDTSWNIKMVASLNGSQSAFSNWAAGGQNTIAVTAMYDIQAIYKKKKVTWKSGANLAYGISKIRKEPWRKTDDNIELFTNLGYDIYKKKLDVSWLTNFRTQFDRGFNLPNDSVYVSKFLAPGYLQTGLGIDYHPIENLQIYVAPITGKFTFVNDTRLANAGAFGVKAAVYDDAGDLVTAGKKFRAELGASMKILYTQSIMENITLKTRLELFSNYLKNPQNIDVNGELLVNFKINKWFQANLAVNIIYDDDIDIGIDSDDDGNIDYSGPRTQIKEVLSLGVSYTFKNR